MKFLNIRILSFYVKEMVSDKRFLSRYPRHNDTGLIQKKERYRHRDLAEWVGRRGKHPGYYKYQDNSIPAVFRHQRVFYNTYLSQYKRYQRQFEYQSKGNREFQHQTDKITDVKHIINTGEKINFYEFEHDRYDQKVCN